jgi:glycosyltransferase involved in cell wall biosynthesis
MEGKIFFLGYIEYNEIPNIYKGADVFVFFSETETQGMVVLEAMSSGVPVLAIKDRVFTEVIENGKDAILIEKNEETFNKNLKKLFKDENLRLKLSQNARKKALKFSLDEMTNKFENLYKELI